LFSGVLIFGQEEGMKMESRERVLSAYNHREPDRVPICIGGTAQKFANTIYRNIKGVLGITDELEEENTLDELGSIINYHPEILDYFNSDFRHVHITRLAPEKTEEDGTWQHELGFHLRPNKYSGLVSIVSHPLRDGTRKDIAEYPWPDPYNPHRFEGVKKRAVSLRNETSYAVGMYKATLLGVFDLCCAMKGMDQFLMDLMIDEKNAETLLERAFHFTYGVYELLLDEIGAYVDVVEFNDDLGTQDNLIMPPDLYRKFIKPYHARLVDLFRKKAPHAKVFLHSCGSVRDVIPDFIEIGIDILNPVQPHANKMDTAALKRDFGSKICFQGGIDLQRAMIGSEADVRKEVRDRIGSLGPDGGYVFSTANNIGNDIPVGNVFALYEEALRRGKYPI
jgi:uroporphyrinogen decarboxylase